MSAQRLGNYYQMRSLSGILLLFCNKFNNFNNTGTQILDSIYHMTLKII